MSRLRQWWGGLTQSVRLRILVIPVLFVSAVVPTAWGLFQNRDWAGLALNFGTGMGGTLLTFILIDLLIGGREKQEAEERAKRRRKATYQRKTRQDKDRLILQLGSRINEVARHAAEELRSRGWLQDGTLNQAKLNGANLAGADLRGASLQRARLFKANLQGAYLLKADLREAHLAGADLQGAHMGGANLLGAAMAGVNLQGAFQVSAKQLALASRLKGATMPDGSRYDGRYNLPGDLRQAARVGVDCADALSMAGWYGVPLEVYQTGQAWAKRKNLSRFQSQAEEALSEGKGEPMQ